MCLSGLPHTLQVLPDQELITVENRTAVGFRVEVHDEAGNITTNSKLIVRCQVTLKDFKSMNYYVALAIQSTLFSSSTV